MRKPNDKDLHSVETIMACAKKECIGHRLASVIDDLDTNLFKKIIIVTDKMTLTEPQVSSVRDIKTVVLQDKSTGKLKDIDNLPPQFRWDIVCAIWNELNCYEI